MSAIVTALQSDPIIRLRLTYDLLSDETKQKLQEMIDLSSSRYNYDAYKVALKNSNSMPCIPWLRKHSFR
jgi:son of sevenless-like protein